MMRQKILSAAKNIAQRVIKDYQLDELIKHKKIAHKNLYETLGQYPGNGVGFKIWRKSWPAERYVIIKRVEFKGLRTGKFVGVEYYKGQAQSDSPIYIRNCSKRGIWKYDINGATAETQNGLFYSTEELKLHYEQISFNERLQKSKSSDQQVQEQQ